MEDPLEQDWQQLGYCGLTWLVWETDQLCSEQGRPLGSCLDAVTWSYLCPAGDQNSVTVFKTPEQRQQHKPSLQVGFKRSLGSNIIYYACRQSVQAEELVLIASSKAVLPCCVGALSLRGVVLFPYKSTDNRAVLVLLLKTASVCFHLAA